jgi:hypothetical protein
VGKLESSSTVRYSQNTVVKPGVKLTVDLQSLVPTADVALYDYLGARVRVRLLDAVAGSLTVGNYINSEGTIVTAIRSNRYLDIYNYDTVDQTVSVRVEIPLT